MDKTKKNKSKGFSLIEIMVGMVIIIAATTVVLSIIISSFRISSKTTIDATLRQNGNYALSQMSRILQFADTFSGASVTPPPGGTVDTTCVSGRVYHYIYLVYNDVPKTLTCANGTIQIDGESSIADEVNIGACNFSCTPSSEGGPVIGIDFSLSSGASDDLIENRSSIDFSTSVKMRNP